MPINRRIEVTCSKCGKTICSSDWKKLELMRVNFSKLRLLGLTYSSYDLVADLDDSLNYHTIDTYHLCRDCTDILSKWLNNEE